MTHEFFAFIGLAALSMFYGVFMGVEVTNSILSLSFSMLFWFASLLQYIYDNAEYGLWWVFAFPLTLCVLVIMQRGVEYLGDNYKDDPFR